MTDVSILELAAVARALIAERRRRDTHFPSDLFADPAWDILLDLYANQATGRIISVSSLCIAAAVPGTTALRWICLLEDMGFIDRTPDPKDQRRHHVYLTPSAFNTMTSYLVKAVPADLAWATAVAPTVAPDLTATVSMTGPSDAVLLDLLARRLLRTS